VTSILYIFMLCFVSVFTELFFGSMGIILPLTALTVFYVSVSAGWPLALATASVCGLVVDIVYGRDCVLSPFILLVIALASMYWASRSESQFLLFHIIPGALMAVLYTTPNMLINVFSLGVSWGSLFQNVSNFVFAAAFSAIMLPLLIIALDTVSEHFGFEYCYGRSKVI